MSGLDPGVWTAKLIYGADGVRTPPKDLDWRDPIDRMYSVGVPLGRSSSPDFSFVWVASVD